MTVIRPKNWKRKLCELLMLDSVYQSLHAINQNGLYIYIKISKVYTKKTTKQMHPPPLPLQKTKQKIKL